MTKLDFSSLPAGAVLSVAATHVGSFMQGSAGATYSVIVTNQTGAPGTSGIVTVLGDCTCRIDAGGYERRGLDVRR